jgi:hypothetical protein
MDGGMGERQGTHRFAEEEPDGEELAPDIVSRSEPASASASGVAESGADARRSCGCGEEWVGS